MVRNIKFEIVSPLQVKIEDLGLVYQVMELRLSETRLAKFVLVWLIMVHCSLQCRGIID